MPDWVAGAGEGVRDRVRSTMEAGEDVLAVELLRMRFLSVRCEEDGWGGGPVSPSELLDRSMTVPVTGWAVELGRGLFCPAAAP